MKSKVKVDGIIRDWKIEVGTQPDAAVDRQRIAAMLSQCRRWSCTAETTEEKPVRVEITVPNKDDQELLIKEIRLGKPIAITLPGAFWAKE